MLRRLILTSALAVLPLGSLAGAGCGRAKADPEAAGVDPGRISVTTLEQLTGWLAEGKARAVDANGDGTRHELGVIPGAILLSHYRSYDLAELPKDHATRLVFYCANEACGASHAAAERAVIAGYADVRVFAGGIAGWRSAGRDVTRL